MLDNMADLKVYNKHIIKIEAGNGNNGEKSMSKLWKPFDWIFNIYKERRMKRQGYRDCLIRANKEYIKFCKDAEIASEQFVNHILEGSPISHDSAITIVRVLRGRHSESQFRKKLEERGIKNG